MNNDEIQNLKARVSEIEKRLLEVESKIGQKTKKISNKSKSIREFLLDLNLSSYVEKTLAIGYYCENYLEMESFNVRDIEAGYRRAKEKVPLNINDKIAANMKKGFVDEAEEKKDNIKAWYLTASGEKCIENDYRR